MIIKNTLILRLRVLEHETTNPQKVHVILVIQLPIQKSKNITTALPPPGSRVSFLLRRSVLCKRPVKHHLTNVKLFSNKQNCMKRSFNVMLLNYPIRACQCLAGLYVLSLVTAHYYKKTGCPQFHSGGISHFKKNFLSYMYCLAAHLPLRYL